MTYQHKYLLFLVPYYGLSCRIYRQFCVIVFSPPPFPYPNSDLAACCDFTPNFSYVFLEIIFLWAHNPYRKLVFVYPFSISVHKYVLLRFYQKYSKFSHVFLQFMTLYCSALIRNILNFTCFSSVYDLVLFRFNQKYSKFSHVFLQFMTLCCSAFIRNIQNFHMFFFSLWPCVAPLLSEIL